MSEYKNIASVFAFLFSLLLSITSNAQDLSNSNLHFNEKALGNLVMGVTSENEGLKRSSIYYAGKYRVSELSDVILDEMKNETNPEMRCLMAMSLYKIKDADAMDYITKLARYESDKKVRNMCRAITELYSLEKTEIFANK